MAIGLGGEARVALADLEVELADGVVRVRKAVDDLARHVHNTLLPYAILLIHLHK